MIIRQVDANGDWTFGKGLANYAKNEQAIDQNVKTRILSWIGDCFFALQDGIDWKSRLDVGQQLNLESEIKANIVAAFGVVGVTSLSFKFDPSNRLETIHYDIQTIFSSSFTGVLNAATGVTG